MPLPVLAGLPFLASLLGGLFGALITFFAKYVTRRVAITLAVVAALVAVTGTFFTAVNALLVGLDTVLPAQFTVVAGHFMPSNIDLCIATYLAIKVLRWAYEWNVKVIQLKLF